MSRSTPVLPRLPRALRVVIALAVLAAGLSLAPAALAADPTFGEATATATFGEAIEVEQPATLPAGVRRVEAVVRSIGDNVTFLSTIPTPGEGATTLRYRQLTPSGAIYPNTRVELGFRVTLEDGREFDGPTTTVRYEDTRFAWRTLDGPIVRVHWVEGNDAFGRRALEIGERAIAEATELLGVTETEPIDFFIYGDRDAFYDVLGPGLRENVGGVALPEIRTLFANIPPAELNSSWVGIVIPHELTHLVFGTATENPYHPPPHWLNEGLADYLAQGYNAGARANVERAARSGDIMPLRALVGLFPTTSERFSLAYDESVSAIDYLIRTHGQDALVSLIRSYEGGVGDDDAFRAALGVDVATFEAGWLADLGIGEPPPYGPRPAPLGPVPPGWAPAPEPSAGPFATVPPASPGLGEELVTPVVVGVLAALAVILVAGMVLAARSLSRGQPVVVGSGLPEEPYEERPELPGHRSPSEDAPGASAEPPADPVEADGPEPEAR